MPTQPDRLVLASDDPLAEGPGGWQTLMRAFLARCSQPERYAIAALAQSGRGTWSRREHEGRSFPYLELGREGRGSKRLAAAAGVARLAPQLSAFRTVYTHGPELLAPLILRGAPTRPVLHVLGDLRAEIAFSRHGRILASAAHAYEQFSYAVMRRCERVLWVDASRMPSLPHDVALRSSVLATFFDPDVFKPPASRTSSNDPLIVSVSRLTPLKRVDVVLRAVALAAARGDRWRLAVCGGGPAAAGLVALARELSIDDRVEWHLHFVPSEELARILQRADAGVLVSAAEGSPSVVKEMLATGLPVVVSAVGDNRVVVEDGRTGILVEDVTPAAVEAALRRAVAFGEEARRAAAASVDQYSLPTWIATLEDVFDAVEKQPARIGTWVGRR